jgi:hypothetical protein
MPIAISANFLRFELVVNLKTAKDIGHEVSAQLDAFGCVLTQSCRAKTMTRTGDKNAEEGSQPQA